jgi:hypothetical protein
LIGHDSREVVARDLDQVGARAAGLDGDTRRQGSESDGLQTQRGERESGDDDELGDGHDLLPAV